MVCPAPSWLSLEAGICIQACHLKHKELKAAFSAVLLTLPERLLLLTALFNYATLSWPPFLLIQLVLVAIDT